MLDLETFPIHAENVAPQPVCVQILQGSHVEIIPAWEPWLPDFLLELFESDEIIVGHNIAYDFLCLARNYPILKSAIWSAYDNHRIEDTMVRHRLIDIAEGTKRKSYSLAALAASIGEEKNAEDPWRLRYGELWGISLEQWPIEALEYAGHDVVVTDSLYRWQSAHYESPDRARQACASWWLHHIADYGIFTDANYIKHLRKVEQFNFDRDRALLTAAKIVRPNGTRDVKAARARAESLGVVKTTKKGSTALDAAACASIGDSVLEAYARYTSRRTLIKRIDDLALGTNGTIRPRYESLKATGRTSSIRGDTVPEGGSTNSLQMQNLPRSLGLREAFIPAPGECIIACDYSQMELCTWAQVCLWALGHSDMADALNAGLDPHLAMGGQLIGRDYDWMLENHETTTVKDARQAAKAANFGFPGGLGVQRFVEYCRDAWGLKIDLVRGKEIRQAWETRWSEAREYFDWINRHREHNGKKTIKHFLSERVCGGLYYTNACNYYFQGLASDAAKLAGYNLVREIELGELQNWGLWNFVHDEFLLRGPIEDCDRAAKIVSRIMEDSARCFVPDVPPKAEPVVMDRWSKKAKRTFNDRGELVPCHIHLSMN